MPDSAVLLNEGIRAEKLGMLDRALASYEAASADSSDPDVAAEALRRLADIHRIRCDWDVAVSAARRAQKVARDSDLPERHAEALNAEAAVWIARGGLDAARPLLEEMAAVSRDVRLRGIALQNLGAVYAHQHDLDAAERAFAESSACFTACDYERGRAIALNNQGRVALDRGDADRATQVLGEALRAARDIEDEELVALATTNLGEATLATENYARANDLVCTALGHFRSSGNRWREVECLRLLGVIGARRGHEEEARRCLERGLALAREIDARLEVAAITAEIAKIDAPAGPA